MLDGLPDLDDGGEWYRETALAHLQDLHFHVLAVIVDLATEDGSADVEQGWLDAFGDRLTSDEALLLRRAAARPKRMEALLRWWNTRLKDQIKECGAEKESDADDAPPLHPLVDLADAYHATIVDLFQRAADDASADPSADELSADLPAQ